MTATAHEPLRVGVRRFEYKVIDTGAQVEDQLNELGSEGGRSSV